ncbi:MAG: hypothetical protein QOK16_1413, partial [Solirubrobacteraceae bacterium]|nr:hypothetical protein [Solirubrobacteraceae bacterium]
MGGGVVALDGTAVQIETLLELEAVLG